MSAKQETQKPGASNCPDVFWGNLPNEELWSIQGVREWRGEEREV